MEDYLFAQGDLHATLRAYERLVSEKVDAIPRDQFMNAQPEEVIDHILSEMTVEPLKIYEDRAEMEDRETKIDISGRRDRNLFGDPGPILVSGVAVSISVPFTGDPVLWKLKPNHHQFNCPRAEVVYPSGNHAGHVQINMAQPADEDPGKLKDRLNKDLETIRYYVQSQTRQIERFNAGLHAKILAAVSARRDRIQKHEGLQDALGIPMKRKEGSPDFEFLKIARKLVRPLPPFPKTGYKPEPGITDDNYSHILSVIRHEGRTFETTPSTYAVHDEEELRDILLAHLNGHYQDSATGGAFRRRGKTDIRIESDNRAAFVAECKIWKGQKELSQAINQLLSYLTWRDCKAAIVVFNKHNSGFNKIIESVSGVFEAHPQFRRSRAVGDTGEWQFDMSSLEDEGRQVRVHVFVFNLFVT